MKMIDFITYIRNLLSLTTEDTRKRRAEFDDCETLVSPKLRKISTSQMSNRSEDDWVSTSSSGSLWRRSALHSTSTKPRTSFSKENAVINIDDYDDEVEVVKSKDVWHNILKKSNKSTQFTSTPNNSDLQQSQSKDDVTFVEYIDLSKGKKCVPKRSFESVKPLVQNGVKSASSHPVLSTFRDIKSRYGLANQNGVPKRRSILDQSFRLDEKLKYKELLAKVAPNSVAVRDRLDAFSKYSTPVGRLMGLRTICRSKRMVNMARGANEKIAVVDLTTKSSKTSQLSAKETIKKVLDDFDNEVVHLKDSDSDVEILPVPPSPKPDFPVNRVNSMKTVVDTSEPAQHDWLTREIQIHEERVAERNKAIQEQQEQKEKFHKVNAEIHYKILAENVRRSLVIREVVLPEEIPADEPILPALSEDQISMIRDAISPRENPNHVLAQKFNLNITRRDIMTLAGLNWLNDEVINFYMNLIIERGKDPNWPKAYAMNTFFYPKLLKDGQSSLRRWTRRVDIFAHDLIAVPIHLGVHWCMAIIDFRNQSIKYYDSMGSANRRCLEELVLYLQAEHLDKKKSEYDTSDWHLESASDIPQQMNGSDCGMFACTFAEYITRNAKITFSQEDMPYFRKKMVLEILTGQLLIA